MFQDSVPAGSYNDPFLSSVWTSVSTCVLAFVSALALRSISVSISISSSRRRSSSRLSSSSSSRRRRRRRSIVVLVVVVVVVVVVA